MTYEKGYNFGAFSGDGKQGNLPARGISVLLINHMRRYCFLQVTKDFYLHIQPYNLGLMLPSLFGAGISS